MGLWSFIIDEEGIGIPSATSDICIVAVELAKDNIDHVLDKSNPNTTVKMHAPYRQLASSSHSFAARYRI